MNEDTLKSSPALVLEKEQQGVHKKLDDLFSTTGPLSMQLKGFEVRTGQKQMAHDVLSAFEKNQVALIEAGTGIGKSFAYLIPSLIWAHEHGERIVISTNTIALQEQLIEKDLPFAMKVCGIEMKVVLAKGMRNYVCLRKLHEETEQMSLIQDRAGEEIQAIFEWSRSAKKGSRSELPFFPYMQTWEKIAVDPDACNNVQCPSYKSCFFFQAKRENQDAQIVICNHHLLFADLAARRESENFAASGVLPAFSRLVIDEAHHIEDVATEYFADRVSRLDLLKVLSLLGVESEKKEGKLAHLKRRIYDLPEAGLSMKTDKSKLLDRLEFDLLTKKRLVFSITQDFFDTLVVFTSLFPSQKQEQDTQADCKLRLKKEHVLHPFWKEKIDVLGQKFACALEELGVEIQNFELELQEVKNERFQESIKGTRVEMKAFAAKILTATGRVYNFLKECSALQSYEPSLHENTMQKIHWIEIVPFGASMDVRLITSEFDVSKVLRENLFEKLHSTVLCSATLATQKGFGYMKKRLGLAHTFDGEFKAVDEKIYESPFPYEKNALLGVPTDFPEPTSKDYFPALCHAVVALVEASRGNAFVLFTSYGALKMCYEHVEKYLREQGFHLLKQGDDHRRELIRRFKETPRSVLFGTDSFWEGVDVVGDALRCVIITKLPFQVPTEPLIEARVEAIASRGGSPFFEYLVPKACVKFKQAFGRLIRHKDDRGCVVCLDVRVLKKNYGKQFLQSLPKCYEVYEPFDVLTQKMGEFYKKKKSGV